VPITHFACEFGDYSYEMWQFLLLGSIITQYFVMKLDRYDKLILEALQRDGRKRNVQLASAVNLSESACLRRVRALEGSGMIDRYTALVSQPKAGLPGNVFVHITFLKSWSAT
jgi:hypothetical protein